MRDLYSNIAAVPALAPAVQSASVNGAAIALTGYKAVSFVVNTGAIVSAGDFSAKLQESEDGSTGWTDVNSAQVDGDAPDTLEASSTYRLGYSGFQPHIRIVLTKAGGTSIAAGAVAVLVPLDRPVS